MTRLPEESRDSIHSLVIISDFPDESSVVLLETALPRHSVFPTPGRGLEKLVGRVGGYTTPTLSWGLSRSVVSMGSEKRGMKGRDPKPQGLK